MIRCEKITHEILPAVRAFLAKELMRSGLNQTEIAEILQVTQPAVSQYLKKARAKKVALIEKNPDIAARLRELAERLSPAHVLQNEELEELCHEIVDHV